MGAKHVEQGATSFRTLGQGELTALLRDALDRMLVTVDDLPAVLDFEPPRSCSAYGRIDGGTSRGDLAIATRFRCQFFAI